jgi:hypothetical protein
VPLVVVGQRPTAALLDREARLGAVQGLDLALLVDAEDQGLVGRVQVQSPTTSVSFSAKRWSRDTLKGRTRCGWRPWACQMRATVALLTPKASAIVRVLQWVAPFGVVWVVACTMACTLAVGMLRRRPRPGASFCTAARPPA